ncbi:hypothetical protein OHA21_05675 [Actinoplanes sp. NBC_00393]|uniref:hypothetical protein n=1 Tax=Actinoplanes sp. NBC_00393 TaxID=2975953 RepID=UPI002E23C261
MADEKETLAGSIQELAWAWARNQPPGDQRMDVASPYEHGLTHEQRRRAWLATLSGLNAIQAEITELTATAASRAAEYGADYPDIGRAIGMTRQGARRRWPQLSAFLGRKKSKSASPTQVHASADALNDPVADIAPWLK